MKTTVKVSETFFSLAAAQARAPRFPGSPLPWRSLLAPSPPPARSKMAGVASVQRSQTLTLPSFLRRSSSRNRQAPPASPFADPVNVNDRDAAELRQALRDVVVSCSPSPSPLRSCLSNARAAAYDPRSAGFGIC